MTLTLAIDFETSGLVRKNLPLEDPSQPHIVEIGASMVDDDDAFECGILSVIIKPEEWTIEDDAVKTHLITTRQARAVGIPILDALKSLMVLVKRADLVIAHNMEFERRLLTIELLRLKVQSPIWNKVEKLCTMETSMPVLKLPSQFDGEFKFPKLSEAHIFLLPAVNWIPKHRALDDARAALRVYRALQHLKTNGGKVGDHAQAAPG